MKKIWKKLKQSFSFINNFFRYLCASIEWWLETYVIKAQPGMIEWWVCMFNNRQLLNKKKMNTGFAGSWYRKARVQIIYPQWVPTLLYFLHAWFSLSKQIDTNFPSLSWHDLLSIQSPLPTSAFRWRIKLITKSSIWLIGASRSLVHFSIHQIRKPTIHIVLGNPKERSSVAGKLSIVISFQIRQHCNCLVAIYIRSCTWAIRDTKTKHHLWHKENQNNWSKHIFREMSSWKLLHSEMPNEPSYQKHLTLLGCPGNRSFAKSSNILTVLILPWFPFNTPSTAGLVMPLYWNKRRHETCSVVLVLRCNIYRERSKLHHQ